MWERGGSEKKTVRGELSRTMNPASPSHLSALGKILCHRVTEVTENNLVKTKEIPDVASHLSFRTGPRGEISPSIYS